MKNKPFEKHSRKRYESKSSVQRLIGDQDVRRAAVDDILKVRICDIKIYTSGISDVI